MIDLQSATPRHRTTPRLSDFGSPVKLYELVSKLKVRDALVARHLRANVKSESKIHTEMEAVCRQQLDYYLGLLNLGNIQRHFLKQLALSQTGNAVLERIDTAAAGERGWANVSVQALNLSSKPDYTARVLAGRKAELEGQPYDDDLFDPKNFLVGDSAFEIYRRGVRFEAAGRAPDAEAMYAYAIKMAPRFSLALRGLARLVRQRDSAQAASCYAAALDDLPQMSYGHIDATFFAGQLKAESTYRDFRVLELTDRAVAVPSIVGSVDFSDRALRSRLHRFAGLFLLRVRLGMRRKGAPSAQTVVQAQRAGTGLGARMGRILQIYAPPLVPLLRPLVRAAKADQSLAGRLRRMMKLAVGPTLRSVTLRLLSPHKSLFDFALVDSSPERLKAQIDWLYVEWLAAGEPPAQPAR